MILLNDIVSSEVFIPVCFIAHLLVDICPQDVGDIKRSFDSRYWIKLADGLALMQVLPAFGDASHGEILRDVPRDLLDHLELVPLDVHGLVVVELDPVLPLAASPDELDAVEGGPIGDVEDEGDLVLLAVPDNVVGVVVSGVVCEDGESVS